ncbi:N-acetylglucosamine-6-phosphate deacetylase [Roseobacter cerasinus]|uniref:N-acetylglucosamine-6-phosphate deacetylase n=1 Tax=Roseobacter cerasinus TaxID=2602289 RepID=A0A640VUH2_9RHOB|nr:N-acetylglucosamine-6-phosphate deacetylase [Roseobacter cerasinus]GFE50751.1 N-acetylglucosamine-6-phosphate deacetylase [Roseobacter cerasinus]
MSTTARAYVGARIHDGEQLHSAHGLLVDEEGAFDILPEQALPPGCVVETLEGGLITPGFVDLQVNGGGGVMFNDDQSVATLKTIADAHARSGTYAILPTLITDTPDRTRAAINAVEEAIAADVQGIVGLHLEGPHLSVARKGAHDPSLIRPMSDADLRLVLEAAERLPNVMITVAPENTTGAQISKLAEAGVVVSLGHTDADAATCHAAFDAGARCVTHLFNAMSQMGNREPGLVGATLARDDVHAGLIADGIHVHPTSMRVALAAKAGIFLVTDAMATAGSEIDRFHLNGREVFRAERRLTLADGTLAGADLEIPRALEVMTEQVGDTLEAAVARTTSIPASVLRQPGGLGHLSGRGQTALYFRNGWSSPQVLARAAR